jgi:hypothetical protein
LWSIDRLIFSWVSGLPLQMRSAPATTRLVNQPLVGMVTIAGRHARVAERMMSGRSPRRNGSPPLKVIHAGARPTERKTAAHSSASSSFAFRS